MRRAVNWHAHVSRASASDRQSWPALLHGTQDASWVQQRRVAAGSRSALGGRTQTRAGPGAPTPRWQEAVAEARIQLEAQGFSFDFPDLEAGAPPADGHAAPSH